MIGYLDLPSGISGDMFLGCLVDAGWPIEQLRGALRQLKLPARDWAVESKQVMKGPFRATLVDVRVTEGAPIGHPFVLAPSQAHGHTHRNLTDIRSMIQSSDLPGIVKEQSVAVFTRLAHAEARVHGSTLDQIHFHEVGALDAIIDIVGTVAAIHELGIEALCSSAFPMSHGWTDSQHGKLPLPAPATLEILSAAGAPGIPGPGEGEHVTPTGAALVCELAKFHQPAMQLHKIAIGAGKRDSSWPNVARLWLGAAQSTEVVSAADSIVQIETNIDDMNPQFYAPLSERLFAAGALDVWLTPIQMKKNRPGVLLGVLANSHNQRVIADLILRETTTLGVRVTPVHRFEAEREMKSVSTSFGMVRVKLKKWNGHTISAMPEYEDCRRLSDEKKVPLQEVYNAALTAVRSV